MGHDRKWQGSGQVVKGSGQELGGVRSYPWSGGVAVGGALWRRRSPRWCDAVVRVQGAPLGGVPGVWLVPGIRPVPGVRLVPGIWLVSGVM